MPELSENTNRREKELNGGQSVFITHSFYAVGFNKVSMF